MNRIPHRGDDSLRQKAEMVDGIPFKPFEYGGDLGETLVLLGGQFADQVYIHILRKNHINFSFRLVVGYELDKEIMEILEILSAVPG